jgi:hypothetical protein
MLGLLRVNVKTITIKVAVKHLKNIKKIVIMINLI